MARSIRAAIYCLAAVFATSAMADIQGEVIGVSDGDTITVLDAKRHQHRVRLSGIDAPEKSQPFGARSKLGLSECAFARSAVIEGQKIDRYGRLIGKVIVEGVDCNRRQVELGLAWHFKHYEREQPASDRRDYAEAEDRARRSRLGLWGEASPQAPWAYRASLRKPRAD